MDETVLPINQIVHGDCIKTLNALPEGWVDLCFADPPFNIGYRYHNYDDRKDVDEYLAFSRHWMRAVVRSLRPGGSFYLAIGDEFASDLCVIARRELGLTMRSWIIWHYTFGQQTRKRFAKSHTHILYFAKSSDLAKVTFNADAIRVASARQTTYRDARANPKGKLPDDTWYLRPQEAIDADPRHFAADSDTWCISRVCGTFKEREGWHGCQMPIAVLDRIIKASSNPNDIVLDPFNGSGTTAVAAALLGRRFVGVEQSAQYVDYARKRLAHVFEQQKNGTPVERIFDQSRSSRRETETDALGRPRVKRKSAARVVANNTPQQRSTANGVSSHARLKPAKKSASA